MNGRGFEVLRGGAVRALPLLTLIALLLAAGASAPAAGGSVGGAAATAAAAAGAAVYAENCSVCHGPTGGGLEEARLAFPPSERVCSRCHKANNPVVMPLTRPFVDNDMFPIGEPPALRPVSGGANSAPMAAVVPPAALFEYIRATMPRYHPGRVSDAEYWLLSAFLLRLNSREGDLGVAAGGAAAAGWLPE